MSVYHPWIRETLNTTKIHQKVGPYQRTPKEVTRAIRYSGLGVRLVGPVGDFLDKRFNLVTHRTKLGPKLHNPTERQGLLVATAGRFKKR